MNYYKRQLERLKETDYLMAVKFVDGLGTQTNNMNLNKESIPVIIEWLLKLLKEV